MSVAGKWNISMDTPIGTQKFTWDADNVPRFGRPLPPGVPIDTKPEE